MSYWKSIAATFAALLMVAMLASNALAWREDVPYWIVLTIGIIGYAVAPVALFAGARAKEEDS